MAAEVQDKHHTLSKVDSAVDDTLGEPVDKTAPKRRRASSNAPGVFNINDLEKEGVELKIAPETQRLNWKLNTAPSSVEDKAALKEYLCTPKIKKIDLHFPLGLEVTARNRDGVTIKDALDAIYSKLKIKKDDELEEPYLAGFEWDKDECYTKFIVHQKKTGDATSGGSKKKKGKSEEE